MAFKLKKYICYINLFDPIQLPKLFLNYKKYIPKDRPNGMPGIGGLIPGSGGGGTPWVWKCEIPGGKPTEIILLK